MLSNTHATLDLRNCHMMLGLRINQTSSRQIPMTKTKDQQTPTLQTIIARKLDEWSSQCSSPTMSHSSLIHPLADQLNRRRLRGSSKRKNQMYKKYHSLDPSSYDSLMTLPTSSDFLRLSNPLSTISVCVGTPQNNFRQHLLVDRADPSDPPWISTSALH